jgi:hypothetical protein
MAGTGGSTLPFGPGSKLWKYWTEGVGFAKWAASPHKWDTLHRLLLKAGVPAHMAAGLTTNMIQAKFPNHKFGHQK